MKGNRPGPAAFVISAAVHAVLLVPLVVLAKPPEPIEFETIAIRLVSPPPADVVAPAPEQAQPEPQPEPEPVETTPDPDAVVETEPEREPEPEIERPETEKPPDVPEERVEPTDTDDAAEADAGGDNIDIATEGREFPFPEYLGNVIVQVKRYFRWNDPSHPRGVIYFEILPDGSVRGIRMVRSSGNIRFDFAVQGAVETAGNRGAFGPLPDAYAGSFLPVQLEVEPPR